MNKFAEVVAIVEGPTEQIFMREVLAPYLATKNIFITPIIITKPGQKGGDVKFSRAKKRYRKTLETASGYLPNSFC